ncbi:MAG TPA: ABC transporter substrate-binding protein [Bacillota bacterium]|nr:ABC transporter substrate-binding protein [Bacillota bacterium]
MKKDLFIIRILNAILIISLFFVSGIFGGAVNQANASGKKITKIRYALLTPGLGNAHIDLAIEKGIYKRNGIELEIFNFSKGGAEAMAAVASGQIDAGSFGSPILTGISKKIPIKVIGSPATKDNPFILVARNEIKTIQDLKGKTVAAGLVGNGTYQAFLKIIKAHGLTIDDFKVTNSSNSSEALLILQSGRVAAAITSQPTSTVVELAGAGHTIAKAVDYFGNYQHSYIFASDALIKNNPDAVHGLLKSELEARKYAKEHPQELITLSKKKYDYDLKVINQYFKNAFKEWNYDGAVNKEGTRNALKILEELGETENVDKLKDEDIFDLRFLPSVKK